MLVWDLGAMDAWTWLEEPRCQGRRACVCVRGRGLSGRCYRGLFAFLSGSEIEFHYYVMELSLLHIPHPSLWLAQAPTRGCLQAGDRWAAGGQSSHQAGGGQAGTAKDRLALDATEIQKALQSYFHRTGPENTEGTCIILRSN